MTHRILVLGGTLEARRLAHELAERGTDAIVSLAGRVADPKPLPLPVRLGGFGGAEGLSAYLHHEQITHVIDATHPFAAQMSRNAIRACAETQTPLVALTRPAWQPQTGDDWRPVPDMDSAALALAGSAKTVFLAIGRMHLETFAPVTQHHYVLRLVDRPQSLPFADPTVIVSRGAFDLAGDLALMRAHNVDLVVSKNSGGTGAYAKIEAARQMGIPVIMIQRPTLPARHEVHSPDAAIAWIERR